MAREAWKEGENEDRMGERGRRGEREEAILVGAK